VGEVAAFLAAVAAFLVVGIGVGILVARWLDRRVAEDDPEAEEPGGDERTDA
jgi:uncharacterized membrane-anchored protein YhcB (DUF1043 family)